MSPAKVAAWIESADLVIAADSGLLRVLESGFVPDIVIGDFDSVSMDMIASGIVTIFDEGQDNTDCGKLLDYVKKKGFSKATIICSEGDLSDHFLDTIHSCLRSDLTISLGLERGQSYILSGPTRQSFSVEVGCRVSLIPLETLSNTTLSGVAWPFEGQTLSARGFTSISNKATENIITVAFDEGAGYLFIEREEPKWFDSVE